MHPTHKHLEDPIRIGGLTLAQWAQILVCGLAAYALSTWLPLPDSWSLSVAVTVCGLPSAAAIAFMSADFDVPGLVRSAVRWRRAPRGYAGTAGMREAIERREGACMTAKRFDSEVLWD